jgi:hypothetical protein
LVVLISHAAPGATPGTPAPTAGERQVITTQVDDGGSYTLDLDIQAQDDTVFVAIGFRPGTQLAH